MSARMTRRMAIKPLIPLCLATFAGFLNLFGMNPFFVDIAEATGSTVSMVGYSATAALLTTAIAGLIIGPLASRIGVRRTLIAGLIIAALGAAATALAINFGSLILGRFLAGVGGSVTGGVTVAAAALLYQGRQRQRALAIVTAAAAMAVVIGVVLITTLAEPYGWRGAFLILGAILTGIAVLTRVMLEPDQTDGDGKSLNPRDLVDAYRPLLRHRPLRRLLVSSALHPAVLNGSTSYVGAFLVSQHDTSTRLVGLAFSLIGLTYFIANLIAGNLGRVQGHVVFSGGVAVMGLFWVAGYVLPVSPLVVTLSFSIATFGAGIAWVTLLNMIADRTPDNLGTAMVLSSSLLSFGGAVGIAISAGLLDITNYQGVAIGMGAIAVIAAVVGWVGPMSEQGDAEADVESDLVQLREDRSQA